MPKRHSIELLPDDAGADVVRRAWQALRDDGHPSMLDHTGGTNTAHVSVIEVPGISAADEALAVELLMPLLPCEVRLSGLVVLGGARVTLAFLVEAPDALARAVLQLKGATANPGHHAHGGWLPHLTLGRRIPRERLAAALQAVEETGVMDAAITLSGLRRWDPEADVVRPLTGDVPPGADS